MFEDGSDFVAQAFALFQAVGWVAVIAFVIFAFLGPAIEFALDLVLPPENWDDDDDSMA